MVALLHPALSTADKKTLPVKGQTGAGTRRATEQAYSLKPQNTSRIMRSTSSVRRVTYPVIHPVGILAGPQHAFVAHNGQMLGNVRLRGSHALDDVLHADLAVAEHRDDLEPQG